MANPTVQKILLNKKTQIYALNATFQRLYTYIRGKMKSDRSFNALARSLFLLTPQQSIH